MKKIRVGVAGYGTIGQRLADGVALQEDMELVGIADLAPTLSLQALRERDMIGENGVKYNLRKGHSGHRQLCRPLPERGYHAGFCTRRRRCAEQKELL